MDHNKHNHQLNQTKHNSDFQESNMSKDEISRINFKK